MENPNTWNHIQKTLNYNLHNNGYPTTIDVLNILLSNKFLKSQPPNLEDIISKVLEEDSINIQRSPEEMRIGFSLGTKIYRALKEVNLVD